MHIYKKLHHQPNRSNDTPQQPAAPAPPLQTPSFSDSRITSSSAASASTTAARGGSSTANDFTYGNNHLQQHQQQDYYSSENYQIQLALALNASSSSPAAALIDRENALIRYGRADNANTAADLLSRRYWNYGILDFEERVVDGFYDVYNISGDPTSLGNMPSLADLKNNNGCSDYEVVIVSRNLDPALEELIQIDYCIMLDYPASEIYLLVKRLADLVIEHMGGPVRDANLILAKWTERSIELRTSLHTTVLPIGSLKVGLLRHCALLFKVLADGVGIPCRLVKGNHYTGIEDDDLNIIKLQDESECLLDLMGDPGTLIPTDVTAKDAQKSQFSSVQKIKDTNASSENFSRIGVVEIFLLWVTHL